METVIALLLFGIIGSALMSGLSISKRSGRYTEHQSTGENLARNQMEDTLSQAYQDPPHTYSSIPATAGCTITSQAEEYVASDPNIEKITVTVSYSGYNDYVLETLRTKS